MVHVSKPYMEASMWRLHTMKTHLESGYSIIEIWSSILSGEILRKAARFVSYTVYDIACQGKYLAANIML